MVFLSPGGECGVQCVVDVMDVVEVSVMDSVVFSVVGGVVDAVGVGVFGQYSDRCGSCHALTSVALGGFV